MVRKKTKAVKQHLITSPANNGEMGNDIKEKRRKTAKKTKSPENKNIVSSVSPSTDLTGENSNVTPRLRKKNESINVYLQSRRNITTINKTMFKEIQYLQRSVNSLIPITTFGRVVREIMSCFGDYRVRMEALMALQESSELYLTQLFEDAYFCTLHAKRQTLFVSDINCARRLRGLTDVINH